MRSAKGFLFKFVPSCQSMGEVRMIPKNNCRHDSLLKIGRMYSRYANTLDRLSPTQGPVHVAWIELQDSRCWHNVLRQKLRPRAGVTGCTSPAIWIQQHNLTSHHLSKPSIFDETTPITISKSLTITATPSYVISTTEEVSAQAHHQHHSHHPQNVKRPPPPPAPVWPTTPFLAFNPLHLRPARTNPDSGLRRPRGLDLVRTPHHPVLPAHRRRRTLPLQQ